jgi:hypothetical protein
MIVLKQHFVYSSALSQQFNNKLNSDSCLLDHGLAEENVWTKGNAILPRHLRFPILLPVYVLNITQPRACPIV